MDTITIARTFALLLCLMLVACGGGDEPAAGGSTGGGASGGATSSGTGTPRPAAPVASTQRLPEAGPITEDELKSYLAAVADLEALGRSMQPASQDAAALNRMAGSVSWDGEVGEVLESNGFDDLDHFRRVHVSVATAYAAVAWNDVDEDFGKAELEELEALRPNLSDAQYEQAKESLEATRALHEQYAGANGPNGKLVGKYRAQLDALFG